MNARHYPLFNIAILGLMVLLCTPGMAFGNQWTLLNPTNSPGRKDGHMMDYDIESRQVVLFGDHSTTAYSDETWAFDVNTNGWTLLSPVIRPSPRGHGAMVYDSASDRMILFGGQTPGNGSNGETWTYDFNTNTWENRNPANSPRPRWGHAMAYDSQSDRTIMYGGYYYIEDITWTYDDATNTWENRNLTMSASCLSQRPPAMHLQGMTYDRDQDRVLMFGLTRAGTYETWSYDYNNNCWELRGFANQPQVGDAPVMVYDSQSHLTVLQGDNDETWTYDYITNTWINPNPSPRPATHHHYMAYIPVQDRIILYGGRTSYNLPIETWQYTSNGSGGADIEPPTAPTNLTAMAVSSAQIDLFWNASTDNVGVTGYRVERCQGTNCTTFNQIAVSIITHYSDTSLQPNTSYTYRVWAADATGNTSDPSNPGSATTLSECP